VPCAGLKDSGRVWEELPGMCAVSGSWGKLEEQSRSRWRQERALPALCSSNLEVTRRKEVGSASSMLLLACSPGLQVRPNQRTRKLVARARATGRVIGACACCSLVARSRGSPAAGQPSPAAHRPYSRRPPPPGPPQPQHPLPLCISRRRPWLEASRLHPPQQGHSQGAAAVRQQQPRNPLLPTRQRPIRKSGRRGPE